VTIDQLTIGQTIEEIRASLRDYIEATYHVGHPMVIAQRRDLLETAGVIAQQPYLESTPRYKPGPSFATLGLPSSATSLLQLMADDPPTGAGLLHDPPYDHQARALQLAVNEGKSLVVTTGTGSGKTESFLLPILAKLAIEARTSPQTFATPAIRALVLYPMNALVNDQLGRLRLMLGNDKVVAQFESWAGRPARFARYTSRTLYPGVRTTRKDSQRLGAIGDFYVRLLDEADAGGATGDAAAELIDNLQRRGKWPAKADLRAWYGKRGSRWKKGSEFVRAVTLPYDAELFTRHEVLAGPPDILVTNYSMLEYMLMRPLERPIFEASRQRLENDPDARLVLVIDEAHLYRGAAGAEVGLLLRRLRARLGVAPDRLQVICTSASFSDPDNAREFAAALAGKDVDDFVTIQGELDLRAHAAPGAPEDAELLAGISVDEKGFYAADDATRRDAVAAFLDHRGVPAGQRPIDQALYDALHEYPPMGLLVNATMQQAQPLPDLAKLVFGDEGRVAEAALTTLIALGSAARKSPGEPGLLPCRVHTFYRGVPGLWACVDPDCKAVTGDRGPIGKLYAQPQDTCSCGSRVFEFYTCRHCGSAYVRAYTDNVLDPSFLWSEPGRRFESVAGIVSELEPLDLCLEQPMADLAEPAELDLVTGRANPWNLGDRSRTVYVTRDRDPGADSGDDEDDDKGPPRSPGEFRPCGVCGQRASFGRSSVQDHQTKGDQPFQALVTRQLQVQPPGPVPSTDFAPLRGRKVLAFSDSRQTAARLAPNLQTYAMQDVLRPLILVGLRHLRTVDTLRPLVGLEDLYLAVMLGARLADVRLRPELRSGESLQLQRDVAAAHAASELDDPMKLHELFINARSETPPVSLLRGIVKTITDRWYGFQSLALGSLAEADGVRHQLITDLPSLSGVAEQDDERLALARIWINQWIAPGIWFPKMPGAWWGTEVRAHKGSFQSITRWLGDKKLRQEFDKTWVPVLQKHLCEPQDRSFRIRAARLTLDSGPGWAYCGTCRTTQRPFPGSSTCVACARKDVRSIDPDHDPVFSARKGYYRQSTLRALGDPMEPPMAIVAAEHTAQLNAAQSDEVFSKAEEHELLFQDVNLGATNGHEARSAIDVLSCTTTMEVGIDIGTLSGVALRNMPPSRASYQQRAGRAGRRGNSVATVTAFGSADSHDDHYFQEPDAMIRGPVDDPILSLDNEEIVRRHVTAYLLQRYHAVRLPSIDPEEQPQLFEVLGKVDRFLTDDAPLNRSDFETWLRGASADLAADIDDWLPRQLAPTSRAAVLATFVDHTLQKLDHALEVNGDESDKTPTPTPQPEGEADDEDDVEAPAETGEEKAKPNKAAENLLDRLLYKGVLPRYAFPTDVVAFHVFDKVNSTVYRPVFRYAPSQGLPVALTQYAPGKEVWIDGKLWTSGALYSPIRSDLYSAWQAGRLYFECSVCHYAKTESRQEAELGAMEDCPACGAEQKFGKARHWIRPPGFAHPITIDEGTSPDDQPARSYATRAKLMASFSPDAEGWTILTPRLRHYVDRPFLLVTNTGPHQEGYSYCLRCGLIEPTSLPKGKIHLAHPKPYPDSKQPQCPGGMNTRGLVLGTDFVSDVLLISARVDPPLTLRPGLLATDVALRTVAEAITIAATRRLAIESGELQAEYRPALTDLGKEGLEAEIYLYDTLSGGAGFSRRVGDLGVAVLEDALALLELCPAGCDRSCYRCLRSFRNRFEHDLLDRYLGASLLRYLLRDEDPTLDPGRLDLSTQRLFEDLARQRLDDVELERNAEVDLPGIGAVVAPILARTPSSTVIVGLHGPLTPDYPGDEALREAKEFAVGTPVVLADEIVVARNLPWATQQVIAVVSS
jgi:ATP-dependent helicase YprA (DUF1998 family)